MERNIKLWVYQYMAKINILNRRRQELMDSNLDLTEKIYWLLEDGKRYGTLPFAGLARAGFIAVQMLRSFVEIGVFSEKEYDSFISSLTTVSGQLSNDRANMDKTSFLRKYGHLRPGTYDITSQRYDEAPVPVDGCAGNGSVRWDCGRRRRAAGSTICRGPDLERGPVRAQAHTAVAPQSAARAPARRHAAAARCRLAAIESMFPGSVR